MDNGQCIIIKFPQQADGILNPRENKGNGATILGQVHTTSVNFLFLQSLCQSGLHTLSV